MKIVIDIPEDVLKRTVFYREFRDLNDCVTTIKALENGIPIPDNATNGEVIKILFSDFMYVPWKEWLMIDLPWWNAPYQKGSKE